MSTNFDPKFPTGLEKLLMTPRRKISVLVFWVISNLGRTNIIFCRIKIVIVDLRSCCLIFIIGLFPQISQSSLPLPSRPSVGVSVSLCLWRNVWLLAENGPQSVSLGATWPTPQPPGHLLTGRVLAGCLYTWMVASTQCRAALLSTCQCDIRLWM